MKGSSGNVLFLILIAVALFAALSYAVTKSTSGGGGIGKEKANLAASEILQYSSQVSMAVQRLMLIRGCTENQISFLYDWDGDGDIRNDLSSDQANTVSPADKSCTVFLPEGMNVNWLPRPSSLIASETSRDYVLNGSSIYIGHGDDSKSDLAFTFGMINSAKTLELCNAINELLGLPADLDIPANFNTFFGYFSWAGNYTDASTDVTRIIGDTVAEEVLVGKNAGCFKAIHTGDTLVYFHIVHAR